MSEPLVLCERRDDGVAVLRLNRPPLNPLSRALLGSLTTLATELAGDPAVKAVVSQVPFVDGLGAVLSSPPLFSLKAVGHGLLDVVGSIVSRRHYVPIVGTPDEFALLNKADCLQGFLSLVPEGSGFDNRAPAAISLALSFYRPISRAAEIVCPILMIIAENDSLIPLKDVEKCAAKIGQAKKVLLPVGHFDVYTGELFAKVSAMEAEFLVEHLR
jgi:pimeloyl-ACP methyl ester carboxylesterase